MFTAGFVESTGISSAQVPLTDEGKNGDAAQGDGAYASGDVVFAGKDAKVGPRVLRVKAETRDAATGKRAAHFVDFGPFAVE